MTEPLILASSSASRRKLLEGVGVKATPISPNIDETAAKQTFRAEDMLVRDQAMALAEMKAVKVSRTHRGLVIGGDQMLSLEEQAFDKPIDLDEAYSHLVRLSGKRHILETALVIAQDGVPIWRHLARPKLFVRELSDAFISNYIQVCGEDLLSTVGAYKLEGPGAQLFERIEGDYFSILGLPLFPLLDYLRTRNVILS